MHSEPSSPCHLYSHTAPYGGDRHHKVFKLPTAIFIACMHRGDQPASRTSVRGFDLSLDAAPSSILVQEVCVGFGRCSRGFAIRCIVLGISLLTSGWPDF